MHQQADMAQAMSDAGNDTCVAKDEPADRILEAILAVVGDGGG